MAFTGAATVEQISDSVIRISGTLSLAGAASGTIGFSDKTVAAEVSLGLLPNWQPRANASLVDLIEVRQSLVTDVTTAVPISIVKSGTTHADFVITVHNDSAADQSGVFEFYVQFH